jgi:hypothetical protein
MRGFRTSLTQITLAMFVGSVPTTLAGQTVYPAHEEPRHHLVLDDPRFRVLDVRIPPGDTTDLHLHDVPIAFVQISPAAVGGQVQGRPWVGPIGDGAPLPPVGSVSWDESYPDAPVIHRVANADDHLFRLVGVLNRGPGEAGRDDATLGSAGPVEAEGRWFRSAHHTLQRGATLEWAPHPRTVIAVLTSEGTLFAAAGTTHDEVREGIGEFLVLEAGEAVTLQNRSANRLDLAFVEIR